MGFDGQAGASGTSGMAAAALMYQKLKNEINNSLEKGKTFKTETINVFRLLYVLTSELYVTI